ncbi:MAG: hypothetical protein GXO32_07320 [Crenarchaeota archaeon]|nr:hypothetical protein [Thermoproteota archaeon]
MRRHAAIAIAVVAAVCVAIAAVFGALHVVRAPPHVELKVLSIRVDDVNGSPALVVRFELRGGSASNLVFRLLDPSGKLIDSTRAGNGTAVLKLAPNRRAVNILSYRRFVLEALYMGYEIYRGNVSVWGATPIYISLIDAYAIEKKGCGYIPRDIGMDVKNLGDTPLYITNRTFIIYGPGGACYPLLNGDYYVVPPHGETIVKFRVVCPNYSCTNTLPGSGLRVVVVGLSENITVDVHVPINAAIGVAPPNS